MTSDKKILANLIKRMQSRDHDPLTPLVDAYLLERKRSKKRLDRYIISNEERPRPHGRFSPSTIGGCERQSAFKFLGVPGRTRLDPELELIFDDGNWRHHRWQAMFRDMEIVLGRERFRCYEIERRVQHHKLFISGHLDAMVGLPDPEYERLRLKKHVVDFKGINDYGFTQVYTTDQPKEAHVMQLMTYMRLRKVPRGLLVYENKNNNRFRVFSIQFDPDEWEKVQKWCARVVKNMEYEELPPMHPECDSGNFMWEKCPWSSLCYGTRSREEVEAMAYKDFESPQQSWKEGVEIERRFEQR